MKIIQFAIKGTEDYSKAQDKEIEDFGKIENLLTDTISNIESGNTPTIPGEPEDPYSSYIEKYVNYVPVGTDYTAEAKYSGYTANQVFRQDTSLKWQIWKVENDTLYLISDGLPSTSGYNNSGELYLKGAQGYNNGVTLLDNICQANYGISGNANVKAQNLKLEDVLAVKADGIENSHSDKYETQPYTYPTSGTFAFPSMWYSNERESLDSAQGNRSTAYPYVEEANSTAPASGQKPYYTYWVNRNIDNAEAWKRQEYHNIVMKPAQAKTYWLSSRHVLPDSSTYCYFGLGHVFSNGVDSSSLYGYSKSSPSIGNHNNGIRPLVSIPLRNCEITENTTTANTFDIVIK